MLLHKFISIHFGDILFSITQKNKMFIYSPPNASVNCSISLTTSFFLATLSSCSFSSFWSPAAIFCSMDSISRSLLRRFLILLAGSAGGVTVVSVDRCTPELEAVAFDCDFALPPSVLCWEFDWGFDLEFWVFSSGLNWVSDRLSINSFSVVPFFFFFFFLLDLPEIDHSSYFSYLQTTELKWHCWSGLNEFPH